MKLGIKCFYTFYIFLFTIKETLAFDKYNFLLFSEN